MLKHTTPLFENTDQFFMDEIREGFYVSGMMKRFWAAQLEILRDIAELCEQNDIRWCVDFGTLLGAVRHGGYIPWDDDLDLCMLREDYEKFKEVAKKQLQAPYEIVDFHTHDYFQQVLRVVNSRTLNLEQSFLDKYHKIPFPVGVDIFCLDNVSKDEQKENRRKEIAGLIMSTAVSLHYDETFSKDERDILKTIEEITGERLVVNRDLKRQLYTLGEKYYRMFDGEPCTKVALMRYWIEYGNHCYEKSYFERPIKLPFEGFSVYVPYGYLEKLSLDYGDFVKVNTAGGLHGYPMYEENEQLFASMLQGPYPFFYTFQPEDYKNIKRPNRDQFFKELDYLLSLLQKILSLSQVSLNEQKLLLLEKAQNLAIQSGELIESVWGQETPEVKCLENLCELIFLDYNNEPERVDYEPQINHLLSLIAARKDNQPVLFLVSRAEAWRNIASIYEKEKASGNAVYVKIIPYFIRTFEGDVQTEVSEIEYFPNDLPIYDGEISSLQPIRIYTQMGHDACEYHSMVEQKYFVRNLRTLSDQIIYVPPFISEDYSSEKQKMYKSLEHYVMIPGMFYADSIFVWNENIKETYVQYLLEHSNFFSKEEWIEKFKVVPEMLPNNIKATSCEKGILLYLGLSTILVYQELAIHKIENILKTLKEQNVLRESYLYISKEEEVELKSHNELLYRKWKKAVEELAYGEQVSIEDYKGYYGDPSPLARKFQLLGKPVMIENVRI